MKVLLYIIYLTFIASLQLRDVSSIDSSDSLKKILHLMEKTKKDDSTSMNRINLFDQYLIDKDKKHLELNTEKNKLKSYFKEKTHNNIMALQNKINEIKRLVKKSNQKLNNNNTLPIEPNKSNLSKIVEQNNSNKVMNEYEKQFNYFVSKLNTLSKLE